MKTIFHDFCYIIIIIIFINSIQTLVGLGCLKHISPAISILDICQPISTTQFSCIFLYPFLICNLTINFEVHCINTRKKVQLSRPGANFLSYQLGVYYVSIKIVNTLLSSIAELANDKKHNGCETVFNC